MSNVVVQASFASGELAPQFRGRVDQAKYKTGAAVARNFFVDYRGGVSNRTGSKFLNFALDSDYPVRLFSFQFSTIQNYVLEFGNFYMRVIKDGGYVLETAQAITAMTNANPGVFTVPGHGYTSGDTLFLSGDGLPTVLRGRTVEAVVLTANTLSLLDINGDPIDTTALAIYVSNGEIARYYTLTTPYAGDDLALLKTTQSADVMTLVHPLYRTRDLSRTGHASWSLDEVEFYSSADMPEGLSATASDTSTPTFSYAYRVTSINSDGEESLPSDAYQLNSKEGYPITIRWDPVTGADFYSVYKATTGASISGNGVGRGGSGGIPPGASFGFMTTTQANFATDTNVTPDFTKQPPLNFDPFAPGKITRISLTAGGSSYTSPPTVSIVDPTGAGFRARTVIESGAVVSIIIDEAGEGYSNPTVVFSGGGGSGATADAEFTALSGTFPSVSTYFQQRKYYAASLNQPATLWASKPGQFTNFDYASPIGSGDSISFTLSSQQVNQIKAMLAMPGGLVIFTSGAVWQLSGSGVNTPVTPTQAIANPQSYTGCSDVQPIAINFNILYVQSKGSIVRELTYNFFANIYTGNDITVYSNHLFYRRGEVVELVDWAYAQEPYKLVWCVMADGQMLALTYIKEQELMGWTRHDTFGAYESIAAITENSVDVVYYVVKRLIGGRYVRCIERQAERTFPNGAEDSWFLDCALATEPIPVSATLTMSGASGLVTCTTDVPVAVSTGQIVRAGGGYGIVDSVTSTTEFVTNFLSPVTTVWPDDPDLIPIPAEPDTWSLTTSFNEVTGLEHLNGMEVSILADGNVLPQQTVVDGTISLGVDATKVIVGLPYQSQLQTLELDVGDPSIQGKRKKISAATVKVVDTRGLKIGNSFETLTNYKQVGPTVYGLPQPLLTANQRVVLDPSWNVEGQVCVVQDYPLPMTVLSVAQEVNVGDT